MQYLHSTVHNCIPHANKSMYWTRIDPSPYREGLSYTYLFQPYSNKIVVKLMHTKYTSTVPEKWLSLLPLLSHTPWATW